MTQHRASSPMSMGTEDQMWLRGSHALLKFALEHKSEL